MKDSSAVGSAGSNTPLVYWVIRVVIWIFSLAGGQCITGFAVVLCGFTDKCPKWLVIVFCSFNFIFSVFISVRTPALQEQLRKVTEERDASLIKNGIVSEHADALIEGHLATLGQAKLGFGMDEGKCIRISLYKPDTTKQVFTLLGRYASNPEYATEGRGSYPMREGCLSKAWQHDEEFVPSLPNPAKNMDDYLDQQEKLGVAKTTVKKLNMPSRFYYCRRIMGKDPGKPIAVVVVESTKAECFKKADLAGAFSPTELRHLSNIVEASNSFSSVMAIQLPKGAQYGSSN